MIGAVRSELLRMRRPGMLGTWWGLTALFAVMITMVTFQLAGSAAGMPAAGPGVTFPTVDELESPAGIVAALGGGASMFGVVTLAFWAIVTATDYASGLIRLLVAARPRRWQLLLGKALALVAGTAAATTVAVLVSVVVAPAVGPTSGLDLSAWGSGAAPAVAEAWANLFLALLVWGVLGLAAATLARSAAVAISIGVGWVLVVEPVLATVAEGLRDWLPGAVIGAIATGGSADLSHGAAVLLGLLYVLVGLAVAVATFVRRDVVE